MKGTSFQKPLKFSLLVEGESWQQGDSISGALIVKNHSTESLVLSDLRVQLAYGQLKKVRAKAADAFTVISEVTQKTDLQKEATLGWNFKLDINCPITDSSGSLFLLYGAGDQEKLAQLQLPVHPNAVVREFLKVIETDFRFVVKSQKSAKGWVEAKLAPPSAKAFAMIDQLSLGFRLVDQALEVKYVFHVKKIEASAVSFDVTKQKKELSQSFAPSQYRLPSGRFNDEPIKMAIQEALSGVEAKIF